MCLHRFSGGYSLSLSLTVRNVNWNDVMTGVVFLSRPCRWNVHIVREQVSAGTARRPHYYNNYASGVA